MSEKKAVNPNAVYLGRAVACTRLEQGMKRKQLAVAASISYPFIAEIENGQKWPSFPKLADIAEALGCDSVYLLARAKQIGEDYPLPCWNRVPGTEECGDGDYCTCPDGVIHATALRNGWRG